MFKLKKEKTPEQQLKELQTAEKIRLMEIIKTNASEGKPESENLIVLKELNQHAAIEAEEAKKETEESNRRSKVEKVVGTAAPIAMTGIAFWSARKDAQGTNMTRSQGGRTLSKLIDGATMKFNELLGRFKK